MPHTREGRTTNTAPPAAATVRAVRPPDSPEKRRRRKDNRIRRTDPTLGRPNHSIIRREKPKDTVGNPVVEGPVVTTPTAAVDSAGHTKSERQDLFNISRGKGKKSSKDVLLDKQRRAGLLPPIVKEAPKPGLPPPGRGDRPIGIGIPIQPIIIGPGPRRDFPRRIDIGKIGPIVNPRINPEFPIGGPIGGPFIPPGKGFRGNPEDIRIKAKRGHTNDPNLLRKRAKQITLGPRSVA